MDVLPVYDNTGKSIFVIVLLAVFWHPLVSVPTTVNVESLVIVG
ncbi:MAG: hypothetical protein BWY47_01456 [Bacteroidetes bacterium ADurb.Bin302]|nr:MAG: hypothetical protein BWY47_01456 [Bacteroidetes bacterium ADurb.Bin302]